MTPTTTFRPHPVPLLTVPTYYCDIPSALVRTWGGHITAGMDETDRSILANQYADDGLCWSMLNYSWDKIRLTIGGHEYKLHLYGHSGADLWAIPAAWTWSTAANDYIPPQETGQLHRYDLPLRWGPALLRGDRTGLATQEDSDAIDAFLKGEGLTDWVCTDAWGAHFARYHDAVDYGVQPTTAGTFTFIKK